MQRLILSLPVLLLACDGGDTGDDTSGEDFTVSTTIPASYEIHDGADFSLAILDDADAVVGAVQTGVIATDTDFTFDVPEGDGYALAFWVDSNFGGGTAGTCDFDSTTPADSPDHQWNYAIGAVDADRDFTIPAHNLTFQDVCAAFE